MNVPIYNGVSNFQPGDTPFGFYDYDPDFQNDANRVTKFCAQRLGYPIMEVELQNVNFYTAFEEAVTTYGNELYAFKVRDNMLSFEGLDLTTNLNQAIITPSFATVVRLSQQYAEEAGTGGNVTWYSGSLQLQPGVQDYDLNEWAISQSISGGIEIKRVFYYPPPAVNQLFNPAAMAGLGGVPPVGAYAAGYGLGYGTTGYLMVPTSLTMQSLQAIEINNTVNLANYTFELINNKLRIFPIPGYGQAYGFISIEYISLEERINSAVTQTPTKVTNESNVNFTNPNYSLINSIGRQWIFEYTLSLSKEMLGYVRGKYGGNIPIPGEEISLNQDALLTAATAEKEALITRLREYFDSTSKQALLERRLAESDARTKEINYSPMTIFIG
jgi:hypothetical protein